MSIRNRLAITLVTLLASVALVGSASAQAGSACVGTSCGLGGQIRGQIGDGLPLPISIATGYEGEFKQGTQMAGTAASPPISYPLGDGWNNAEMKVPTATNGFVGAGLGQRGQIRPTASAMITQGVGMPRSVMQAAGVNHYDGTGMIGVVAFNAAVLAVWTNLVFDTPHPGTDGLGATVVVPGTPGLIAVGQRPGPDTVTFFAGATQGANTVGNNWNNVPPVTAGAGDAAGVNGIARFTKTKSQLGSNSTGRTLGTAQVFLNLAGILAGAGCTGSGMASITDPCRFALSVVVPSTQGVAGGPFGGFASNSPPTATFFTGDVGTNGTILNIGAKALTASGMSVTVMGQAATSVGFPSTTGMLTMSVVDALPSTERFVRTGIDARDSDGNGVIALVTGAMSARTISKGNANRTWTTLEIPEPSAIFAASAGLFALFGCHQMVRRRNR